MDNVNQSKYMVIQYVNQIYNYALAMKFEMEVSNLPSLFVAFTLWEGTDPCLVGGMPLFDLVDLLTLGGDINRFTRYFK